MNTQDIKDKIVELAAIVEAVESEANNIKPPSGFEKFYWPKTTRDDEDGREWIHPQLPRFYLWQEMHSKKWGVVDRTTDFYVTKLYKRKRDAIRGFYSLKKDQLGLSLYLIQ